MATYLSDCEIYITLDGDFTEEISGYNGVPFGAPFSFDPYAFKGQSAIFNGVDQYVYSSTGPVIDPDSWTISLWIKIEKDDQNNDSIVFSMGDDTNGFGIAFDSTEGFGLTPFGLSSYGDVDLIYCVYPGIGFFSTEVALKRYGYWNHIVLRRDITETELFVNGTRTSFSLTTSPNTPSQSWYMGGIELDGVISYLYQGVVDDVQVYSRPLTDEEVVELYQGNKLIKHTLYNRKSVSPKFIKTSNYRINQNEKEFKFIDSLSHSALDKDRFKFIDSLSHSALDKDRFKFIDSLSHSALDKDRFKFIDSLSHSALDKDRFKFIDSLSHSANDYKKKRPNDFYFHSSIDIDNRKDRVVDFYFHSVIDNKKKQPKDFYFHSAIDKDNRSDNFISHDMINVYEANAKEWEDIRKDPNIRLFSKDYITKDLHKSEIVVSSPRDFIDFLSHATTILDDNPDSEVTIINAVDYLLTNFHYIIDFVFDDLYENTYNSKLSIQHNTVDEFDGNVDNRKVFDNLYFEDNKVENVKQFEDLDFADDISSSKKPLNLDFADDISSSKKPLNLDFVVDLSRMGKPVIYGLHEFAEKPINTGLHNLQELKYVAIDGADEQKEVTNQFDYVLYEKNPKGIQIEYTDIPDVYHEIVPKYIDYPKEYWKEMLVKFLDIPDENRKEFDTKFIDEVVEKFKLTEPHKFIKRANRLSLSEKHEFIKRLDALKFKINKYEIINEKNKRILVVCPPWREEE